MNELTNAVQSVLANLQALADTVGSINAGFRQVFRLDPVAVPAAALPAPIEPVQAVEPEAPSVEPMKVEMPATPPPVAQDVTSSIPAVEPTPEPVKAQAGQEEEQKPIVADDRTALEPPAPASTTTPVNRLAPLLKQTSDNGKDPAPPAPKGRGRSTRS